MTDAYKYSYHMHMRTTLDLPQDLLEAAARLAEVRTKTETIIVALKEYVRRKRMERLMGASGSLHLKPAWKRMRHGR